jgi:hypothetical protein
MLTDRYVKVVLTVIAVSLIMLAARPWLPDPAMPTGLRANSAEAQSLPPKYELTLPKAWGKILAFSNNNLLMEASDQTLRIVDVEGKAPEYPKIKVQFRLQ